MNRADLHTILDNLDEEELFAAEMHLLGILQRRQPLPSRRPQPEHLRERGEQFRKKVDRRWREAVSRRQGAGCMIAGIGGGGAFSIDLHGRPNGKMAYEYNNGAESFVDTLRFVAGQEVEINDIFALSADGTQLLYEQMIGSGGHSETRKAVFPFNDNNAGVQQQKADG